MPYNSLLTLFLVNHLKVDHILHLHHVDWWLKWNRTNKIRDGFQSEDLLNCMVKNPLYNSPLQFTYQYRSSIADMAKHQQGHLHQHGQEPENGQDGASHDRWVVGIVSKCAFESLRNAPGWSLVCLCSTRFWSCQRAWLIAPSYIYLLLYHKIVLCLYVGAFCIIYRPD